MKTTDANHLTDTLQGKSSKAPVARQSSTRSKPAPVGDNVHNGHDGTGGAWESTRAGAEQVFEQGEIIVRESPWKAGLVAVSIGFCLGLLCARRRHATFRERYIDEPVEHSRGALIGVAGALVALWRALQSSVFGEKRTVMGSLRGHVRSGVRGVSTVSRAFHRLW